MNKKEIKLSKYELENVIEGLEVLLNDEHNLLEEERKNFLESLLIRLEDNLKELKEEEEE